MALSSIGIARNIRAILKDKNLDNKSFETLRSSGRTEKKMTQIG
jgi:hypothetical protein